jgi:hypothetical protein
MDMRTAVALAITAILAILTTTSPAASPAARASLESRDVRRVPATARRGIRRQSMRESGSSLIGRVGPEYLPELARSRILRLQSLQVSTRRYP